MFLVAHSMGGAIASLYIEKYIYDFDGVVLSSPMHQPDLINSRFTGMVCKILEKRESNIDRYVLGEVSYDEAEVDFKTNMLTHSKIRFDITTKEYENTPEVKIGGPSVRWVSEACEWSHNSVEMAQSIQIPVLLMQAAKDKIVNLKPQKKFCKTSFGFCRGIKIDGAYHELFVEKDEIRNKAMSAMFDFFKYYEVLEPTVNP
jgi:lysophospholipase